MIELSIIIVSWNTKDLLRDCLNSVIYNLKDGLRYEIIVVDNASTDGSAKMVRDEFSDVRLIENTYNAGFVGANNQAAAVALGEYILLLNSDTKMIGDGTREILLYLDANPEVGIVTGKMHYEDGEFQPPYRRFPGLLGAIASNTFRRIVGFNTPFLKHFRYADLDPEKTHQIDWATGAYLYMRPCLLTDGKIFDENIFMYYEDTLLCKRAWDLGFKVMYLPLAPIIHYRGKSSKKAKYASMYYSFESSVLYFEYLHGAAVADYYRKLILIIWRILGVTLGLLPLRRFREKAELFRHLFRESERS